MFAQLGVISPPGILSSPVNALDKSGVGRAGWPEPLAFTKRFPVSSQQWSMFQPRGRIFTVFPEGWRHPEFEYSFARRFPVNLQIFAPNSGNPAISAWY